MLQSIQSQFQNFLTQFPEYKNKFTLLKDQISQNEDLTSRKNFKGHCTASALILNPQNQLLLVFHNKLKIYLQPGGHLEPQDKNLLQAAQREAQEETGIQNLQLHSWHLETNSPILIDTHKIPANPSKQEDEHYHHDFMYLFKTSDTDIQIDPNEVSDFLWISLDSQDTSTLDQTLQTAIQNIIKIK